MKKFLANEIKSNTLGSPPNEYLLNLLKPSFWFAAHMHVKFEALVTHKVAESNPDEINLDDEDERVNNEPKFTRFLALDKCIDRGAQGNTHLQVMDIPTTSTRPYDFGYDVEWLAILRATNDLVSFTRTQRELPVDINDRIKEEMKWVNENVKDLRIPANFQPTAKSHNLNVKSVEEFFANPQTTKFCSMLQIENRFVGKDVKIVPGFGINLI